MMKTPFYEIIRQRIKGCSYSKIFLKLGIISIGTQTAPPCPVDNEGIIHALRREELI